VDQAVEIHLQLAYTRPLAGYADMQLSFDNLTYSFVGVGPLGHRLTQTSVVEITRSSYKRLQLSKDTLQSISGDRRGQIKYRVATSSTSFAPFVGLDSEAQPVEGCDICDPSFNASRGCQDDDELCVMLFDAFLYMQSSLVLSIAEVNPYSLELVLGSLGGFWVWVGAIFGLCFTIRERPEKLYPGRLLRWLCCDDVEHDNGHVVSPNAFKMQSNTTPVEAQVADTKE
jgi:hypothetical protein